MKRTDHGAATADVVIAVGLAAVTASGIAWILMAARNKKLNAAQTVVQAVASANQKRRASSLAALTGPIDAKTPIAASASFPRVDWAKTAFAFTGADDAGTPCVLASAYLKAGGPKSRGVCIDRLGNVQRFTNGCTLDCVIRAAPVQPVERPVEVVAPVLRHDRPVVPVIDLVHDTKPKKTGCSVKGCSGTDCCEPEPDRRVTCPGGSCCEVAKQHDEVCKGTCFKEEDCAQGCRCVIPEGGSFGSCGTQ